MAVAGEKKHSIDSLSHCVLREMIRGLEKVKVPQMTAELEL
jgi:hypothetical protein